MKKITAITIEYEDGEKVYPNMKQEEQIAAILNTLPSPKSVWDLKEGDKYWYLADSEITKYTILSVEKNLQPVRDVGNAFTTREAAEAELAKRRAIAAIQKYKHEHGMEWEPDWGDTGKVKRVIVCNPHTLLFQERFIVRGKTSKYYSPIGYFRNEDHAQAVIWDCEEELRKIWNV